MKKFRKTDTLINLLAAVTISIVINFSYMMLLFGDERSEWRPNIPGRNIEYPGEGTLSLSSDGHGYLVYPSGDSVYMPQQRVRWYRLADGDRMVVDVNAPRKSGGHYWLNRIFEVNGEEFDYNTFYNYPSRSTEVITQMLFYTLLSYLLINLVQRIVRRRKYDRLSIFLAVLLAVTVTVLMYFAAPVIDWYEGRVRLNFTRSNIFDSYLILKCSLAFSVSILFAWVRLLVYRQQHINVEVEKLKNESLSAQYNVLVGQISPHFFFNSLNSLSMLVREKESDKALRYIDQLSYTFRYIIQNGQNTLTPLSEEMKFAEAFSYQYSIRYADKLFFDFDVEEKFMTWLLPALSLQPLIGNAVKHNTITKNKPLRVTIRTTEDGWLEISNPIAPKLEAEPSTGIGLENLRKRWRLITDCDIVVENEGKTFLVRLPLQKPAQ